MTITRQQIIDTMKEALEAESFVLAAWLGGSDATGRTDEISDIDMQIIVADDRVEDAYALAHKAIEALGSIEHCYRFPEPTWHGHSQELLRLRDADPNHFLDFVVMKKSNTDRFLERERHGDALVLFDRENLLIPPPLDWKSHTEKMEKRLVDLRAQFPLFQPVVTRGVRRGHVVESAYAYQAMTIRPLVELLRMRYCPERYDFGLRYLDRDLPAVWRAKIEALSYPTDGTQLQKLQQRAATYFAEELAAYDRGEWSLRDRT